MSMEALPSGAPASASALEAYPSVPTSTAVTWLLQLARLVPVRLSARLGPAELCPGRMYRVARRIGVLEGAPGHPAGVLEAGETIRFVRRAPCHPREWTPEALDVEDASGRPRRILAEGLGATVADTYAVLEDGPLALPDGTPPDVRVWAEALFDRAGAVRRFALEDVRPPARLDLFVIPILADRVLEAGGPPSGVREWPRESASRWTDAGEDALVARGEPARRYLEGALAERGRAWDRRALERVLARLGSRALEADYLGALTSDDHLEVRRALQRLRSAGRAVPRIYLEPLVEHPNYNVRLEARRALREIGE